MTAMAAEAADPAGSTLSEREAEDSVEAIVGLHEGHAATASPFQKIVDRASDVAGRPLFVFVLMGAIAAWLAFNLTATARGAAMLDRPPFAWLELALTLTALLLATVIVATQRREDRLAERRAQLTLQLALLSEKKTAKIIALLEEIRRDSPALADRIDPESEKLAAPVDPAKILDRIDRDGRSTPST